MTDATRRIFPWRIYSGFGNGRESQQYCERLQDVQILYTAFDAGLFDFFETPRTAADIAGELDWSERGTAMLLDGLVALDLVTKEQLSYKNTAAASACLAKTGCAYQGHILRHNQNSWNDWMLLEERVKTGTCEPKGENRTGAPLRDFILGMRDIATISAREVLDTLDLSEYKHVLDLACGPASYAIAFLQQYPEMRATLFDKPEVIEIAREQVMDAGLVDRFSFIRGDCMKDNLGEGYDLVFMSNIIHSFSDEENAALVKRDMTPSFLVVLSLSKTSSWKRPIRSGIWADFCATCWYILQQVAPIPK